jgi:DEAD/DEAH box helicase domain-containing protein
VAVTHRSEPWDGLLAAGRSDERLVHEAFVGAASGARAPVPGDLHPALRAALARVGVAELFSHQRAALQAAADGPVIVTTGTASGKSLCFNLPTLHALCTDPHARALYLYPTKALAQDQARGLHALGLPGLRPAIYDGDTPRRERPAIRRNANLVLTNPDMLHVGILPHHDQWGELFANLAAVVVDEAHVYRGVFGSHVANVLRRLRRIADAHGTAPRFLLASATIANPGELAERLTGLEDFAVIDEDGSARAQRRVAMWNPPLIDEALGVRASVLAEGAELLSSLVSAGARTICFIKSRRAVELIVRAARARLPDELAQTVAPYRAGYTAAQRHALEERLVSGQLRGVVATDALELGIDIGALDAAICVTFPGTVASLRQMWGRAGRRGRGLALYVAGEDALDQFFCRHPETFLDRPVESAILDHENEEIHLAHLLCAAAEGPLTDEDAQTLGSRWEGYAERLVSERLLRRRRDRAFVPVRADRYPAAEISLRSASADSFAVVDTAAGEVLGTIDAQRAFPTVHDGAVYLHLGRSYEVSRLDLDTGRALVQPFSGDWYTQARKETAIGIVRLLDRRTTCAATLSLGSVAMTEQVLGYQRKRLSDRRALDFTALLMPESGFDTQALWYEPSEALLADFPREVLLAALHAMEHTQIAVLPLLAMCDRWDIGGLSTAAHSQTGGPTVFIYDGHPGGVGIARQGFRCFETLVGDALALIEDCPCSDGCPSCVQSPKCGNLNETLSKRGARELLGRMRAAAAA